MGIELNPNRTRTHIFQQNELNRTNPNCFTDRTRTEPNRTELSDWSNGTELEHNAQWALWKNAARNTWDTDVSQVQYRMAHKKRPNLSKDVVLLGNRITTKRNKAFKEQLWPNITRNYDVIFFVVTVKHAKEYWVSETYKITNTFNRSHCVRSMSSHSE